MQEIEKANTFYNKKELIHFQQTVYLIAIFRNQKYVTWTLREKDNKHKCSKQISFKYQKAKQVQNIKKLFKNSKIGKTFKTLLEQVKNFSD
jgi:hypothetical protein